MDEVTRFLLAYGYALLFACVLAEQIGLPIPAIPVLLGVGALAGSGKMSILLAIGVAVAASLGPDVGWFELGRRRGGQVLGLLCRISLEPDSCVRRTENLFVRHGRRTLLIAKFFPGLSTLAPPLAGIVGIGRGQFILLDSIGALIWSGAWLGLGYLFKGTIEVVAAAAGRLGNWLLIVIGGLLAVFVVAKYLQRQRILRSLRVARILPEELKRRLDDGDASLMVIDTRSSIDVDAVPYTIPGARWITAEEIERRRDEIPAEREIVLYCS